MPHRSKPPTTTFPIVIAGSVQGADDAAATWRRVLGSIRPLHDETVAHYRALASRTVAIDTPIEQLDTAFSWAKVGIDKGLATNPMLGTGLVAGFRTSGESERPGFAWFFGRDALWTVLASTSIGDFDTVRTALSFLRKFQRDDGKIPHEISQSASLIPWFTDYQYAWASADATPLYVIAHADHWRSTGDREFLQANLAIDPQGLSLSAATDTDGDGLIENTGVGHGWVEGGALYPAHEEIYLQGLWSRSARRRRGAGRRDGRAVDRRGSARGARQRPPGDGAHVLARRPWLLRVRHEGTRKPRAVGRGARATATAASEARSTRCAARTLVDEDTVLPAVPLWFRTLDDRARPARKSIVSEAARSRPTGVRVSCRRRASCTIRSRITTVRCGRSLPGWSAMAAYRYGRPHIGYQAIIANAFLTFDGALGYVTELLSGDFNVAFGRSSHHQVWSEAMVVTPVVRGLLGLEATRRRAGASVRAAAAGGLGPRVDHGRPGRAGPRST